jgi:hypothetical protein
MPKPKQAERTGFEPAEGFNPFTDLANRRFRPLSHLSNSAPGIDPVTLAAIFDVAAALYFTDGPPGCKARVAGRVIPRATTVDPLSDDHLRRSG